MRIIPAIYIIDGKSVRLTQGDYSQKKTYNENPLEVAKEFEDAGIEYLHLVDLDGAKAGKVFNAKTLELIAKNTQLKIDFGGGVKSNADIETVFNAGAAQVTCGSTAVKNPDQVEEWIDKYGTDKLILGADVKDRQVAIQGWTQKSELSLNELLNDYWRKGMKRVICTDIATDGMLKGPNTELYKEILNDYPNLELIASGGVSSIDDLYKLKESGLFGAIVGKAIYEGRIAISELSRFNNA